MMALLALALTQNGLDARNNQRFSWLSGGVGGHQKETAMVGRLLPTTALGLALVSTAGFAATAPQTQSPSGLAPTSPDTQPTIGQNAQNLPQELKQKLTAQGFTDVKVVPDSFLVSAKDKQGHPVTMLIGPNSLTVFTMVENTQQGRSDNQPAQ
jgi:hypothetical protein